jgi:hypothetical protein
VQFRPWPGHRLIFVPVQQTTTKRTGVQRRSASAIGGFNSSEMENGPKMGFESTSWKEPLSRVACGQIANKSYATFRNQRAVSKKAG